MGRFRAALVVAALFAAQRAAAFTASRSRWALATSSRSRSPWGKPLWSSPDGVLGEEPKKELGALAQQGRELAEILKGVPVFLVGMMGCGKTTLGDLFARSLGSYTFLDMDDVIEKVTGQSIPEIFESEGEEEFRKVGLFPSSAHVPHPSISFPAPGHDFVGSSTHRWRQQS